MHTSVALQKPIITCLLSATDKCFTTATKLYCKSVNRNNCISNGGYSLLLKSRLHISFHVRHLSNNFFSKSVNAIGTNDFGHNCAPSLKGLRRAFIETVKNLKRADITFTSWSVPGDHNILPLICNWGLNRIQVLFAGEMHGGIHRSTSTVL